MQIVGFPMGRLMYYVIHLKMGSLNTSKNLMIKLLGQNDNAILMQKIKIMSIYMRKHDLCIYKNGRVQFNPGNYEQYFYTEQKF